MLDTAVEIYASSFCWIHFAGEMYMWIKIYEQNKKWKTEEQIEHWINKGGHEQRDAQVMGACREEGWDKQVE